MEVILFPPSFHRRGNRGLEREVTCPRPLSQERKEAQTRHPCSTYSAPH